MAVTRPDLRITPSAPPMAFMVCTAMPSRSAAGITRRAKLR